MAIGERVQRSHIADELIVLVPHRRRRAASVAALRGNSVARNLDTLFPPSPLFPPLLQTDTRAFDVCAYILIRLYYVVIKIDAAEMSN